MAVCPCGHDYGYDPDHATCPKCGTSTQVWVDARGARAVGHVFPVTVTAESNDPDGSREIVTGSHSHRSATRSTADGLMSHSFQGRAAQGEEDVLEACERLMEALKLQGVQLIGKFRRPTGREQGVDAIAETIDGATIKAQVVQVRDGGLLAELGRAGIASSAAAAASLADDVCRCVEAKRDKCPPDDRGELTLLVDAIRSPGHAFPEVVSKLRSAERTNILQSTGYRAVWLAGSTYTLTYRLDEPIE